MGHRALPAALASVGFLVTFTVRSWHQDLWSSRQAVDRGIASATQQLPAAHGAAIAAPALESPPPLESALRKEAARLRAAAPAAPSAATPSAAVYLADEERQENHSARMH